MSLAISAATRSFALLISDTRARRGGRYRDGTRKLLRFGACGWAAYVGLADPARALDAGLVGCGDDPGELAQRVATFGRPWRDVPDPPGCRVGQLAAIGVHGGRPWTGLFQLDGSVLALDRMPCATMSLPPGMDDDAAQELIPRACTELSQPGLSLGRALALATGFALEVQSLAEFVSPQLEVGITAAVAGRWQPFYMSGSPLELSDPAHTGPQLRAAVPGHLFPPRPPATAGVEKWD
jgi:hypothetical protein